MKKDAPVGVFDSGVGGLTVVSEIMRQVPEEKLVYFGDTARLPYGSKSQDTVLRYVRQIMRFMETKEVKAIVMACNTASAYTLDIIEQEIGVPIIGVVKPGAVTAARSTVNGRIGVIATDGTINSGLYTKFIQSINPKLQVFGKACPLFVPLVEEGLLHGLVTEEIARWYLADLQKQDIDTLILGCTHYPLLRTLIGQIMGAEVRLVNPAYETAVGLKSLLEENDLLAPGQGEIDHKFYVSDGAEKFKFFANSILSYDVETTHVINIEGY